jgi:hypothetical protein
MRGLQRTLAVCCVFIAPIFGAFTCFKIYFWHRPQCIKGVKAEPECCYVRIFANSRAKAIPDRLSARPRIRLSPPHPKITPHAGGNRLPANYRVGSFGSIWFNAWRCSLMAEYTALRTRFMRPRGLCSGRQCQGLKDRFSQN